MRKLPLLLRVATLFFAISTTAVSGSYPSQPIRIIVPGSAGGVLDINVRKISDKLSQSLGQPVIVDNRPGANGIIAAELAAKAKPDGYTVLIASNSIPCTNPARIGRFRTILSKISSGHIAARWQGSPEWDPTNISPVNPAAAHRHKHSRTLRTNRMLPDLTEAELLSSSSPRSSSCQGRKLRYWCAK
jgi:hypothetical protein